MPTMFRDRAILIPLLIALAGPALPATAAAQDQPPLEERPCVAAAPDEPTDEDEGDEADDTPSDCRILVTGSGGGGGAGGPVSFEWNGPGRLDYGIYDHGCLDYGDEFRELVSNNKGLIGSVPPQSMSWSETLEGLRTLFSSDPKFRTGLKTGADLAAEKHDAGVGVAATFALGEPEAALAQLYAAVEKSPDDAGTLFNFAAALSINRLPNESLAAIAHIRSLGKLPTLPLGVNADAALDYQEGYAQMLRGDLAAAKSGFQKAMGQEPFINEAAHGLALIQAHEGNAAQGKRTYLGGMWRFKPKYLIACGGSTDEDVRPPVDDMFDTSMGVEGKLVEFWHPDKAGDLKPFFEMVGALATERLALAEPLKQRMIAMGDNPRFAGGTKDPYDAWAAKMSQLIASLDEIEPFVLQKQDEVERAMKAAQRVSGENQAFVLQRVVELAMQPGNHCPTYRSLISQGIQGVQPHAVRVMDAQREFVRVWYKIATGLNSNIGDPEWFEYNDVSLRAEIESMNAGMLAMMMGYYAFPADLVQECPEEFVEVPYGQQATPEGDPCKEMFGNLKFKQSVGMPEGMPGPKFTAEVSCDSIKGEAEFNLLEGNAGIFGTSMGFHGSAEFKKGGDFMLFAGPRIDASAGGAGLGLEGGIKTGAFIKGNRGGLEDLGGRIELEGKGSALTGSAALKDEMDFGLLSTEKPVSRGPPVRTPPPAPTPKQYRPPQ